MASQNNSVTKPFNLNLWSNMWHLQFSQWQLYRLLASGA